MNNIIPFTHEIFGTIRTLLIDNEPWFVAADVCKALEIGDTNKAVGRLDEDEKGTNSIRTLGGIQEMIIVNEPGLYSLVLGSRKHEAKAFKRWITHEVIPSIRRHGMYATPDTIDKILANPEFGIRLLQELKNEREKNLALQSTIEVQAGQIEEYKPKADYYDIVMQCTDLIPITQIAKDFGIGPQIFNKMLHEYGIQYSLNNAWVLYAKYQHKGYAQTETYLYEYMGKQHSSLRLKWTQKGRLFIYEVMKAHGYLPVCEQQRVPA